MENAMPLDMADPDPLQAPVTRDCVPHDPAHKTCRRIGEEIETISKWGGARPNSGGSRPGAGRKPKPIIIPTYAPDVPRWCVVMFWGQAEISGTRELTRQGYDAYLPMTAIRRRDPVIATKWHTVRVPLLSGYGFIRLAQHESREPIEATRGVREMLRRPDGRLACARDDEIERLLKGEAERLELPEERGEPLKVKARVRIEDGAFAERVGTVLECDGVKTRVEVDVFGRMVPMWLDRAAVVVA